MSDYTVYSKSGCVWCDRLKELMRTRSIPYSEVRVDASPENLQEFMIRAPGVKTVPQLFKGDTRIGGFTEAQMYFNDEYGAAFGDDMQ